MYVHRASEIFNLMEGVRQDVFHSLQELFRVASVESRISMKQIRKRSNRALTFTSCGSNEIVGLDPEQYDRAQSGYWRTSHQRSGDQGCCFLDNLPVFVKKTISDEEIVSRGFCKFKSCECRFLFYEYMVT